MYNDKAIIIIPSRMGSTRLPQKAIAQIAGEPMIVHVWRQAFRQNAAKVLVACDSEDIGQPIVHAGGERILTPSHILTGSDRVAHAIELFDPEEKYEYVINLQGDLPRFSGSLSLMIEALSQDPTMDMVTFAHPFDDAHPKDAPQTVTVVVDSTTRRCTNFSRKTLDTPYYHIGVYGFRRKALRTFTTLPQTPREHEERLEQLRALDHGMSIGGVVLHNEHFISVDTQSDLDRARDMIEQGRVA